MKEELEELEELMDSLLLTSGSLAILEGIQNQRKTLTSVKMYEKTIDVLVLTLQRAIDYITKKIENLEDGE